jgi:hypothetical protein
MSGTRKPCYFLHEGVLRKEPYGHWEAELKKCLSLLINAKVSER